MVGSVSDSSENRASISEQRAGWFDIIKRWVPAKTEHAGDAYTEFGRISEIPGRTLGTFAGVFCPVALSMFSALLFLRVGFVIGNAGLLEGLLQFIIAYVIIFFTVSSICAISTNGEVEGGGAYFMISRTLGPEFGGSIGTLFFFANIVSSALYTVGFAEGLISNFGPSGYISGDHAILPTGRWWAFFYSSMVNLLNLIICLIGPSMFAKTSVIVLGVVTMCISSSFFSFIFEPEMQVPIPNVNHIVNASQYGNYTSFSFETMRNNLYPSYGFDYTSDGIPVTFSLVFGVLFSGVTGIMAGANMSGDLKNPSKNIPKGTLSAVLFTMIIYIVISVASAASCDRFLLQNNYLYLMPINVFPIFITIGILTATFSASLSNVIGASRVLEALAKDNIYGSLLDIVSRGVWKSNPVAAVLISWFLVQLMLLIGSLNTIAQINSILFLLAYLAINLACLGLELASAPNFRPSFKYFTWYTAFVGLSGSLVMMFVINPFYASTSIGLCLLIILLLNLFSPARSAEWGSISQALIFHQVRKYLLLLDSRKDHVKFWRPQILLMVNSPRSCCPLIDFVNDLKKSGLYVLGHVIVEPNFLANLDADLSLEEDQSDWLALIDQMKVKAFVEVTIARNVREGLHHLVRLSGMGAMKPNTIIFGFYDDVPPTDFFATPFSAYNTDDFEINQSRNKFPIRQVNEKKVMSTEYVSMIADVLKMGKNVCICRHFHALDKIQITGGKFKYLDVWPMNFFHPFSGNYSLDTTGLFMMQLSCILTMVHDWKNLRVRVFICDSENGEDDSGTPSKNSFNEEDNFRSMLHSLRIFASIHKVPNWRENLSYLESSNNGERNNSSFNTYLHKVNQMIRNECNDTAIIFTYLPAPPTSPTTDAVVTYENYLESLTVMTNHLPPVLLVHGISAVTSTTL